jgi:uncharacterized repeat protein (TIGR02543 family)
MYFDINWRNNKSPNLTAKNLNRMQEIAEELYNEAVYQKQSGENALIIRKNIDPNFIEPWEIFYMDGSPIVLDLAVGKTFLAFVEDPNGKLCYKTNGVEFRFRTVSREEAIFMLNSGTEDGGEDSGSSGGGSGGSEDDKPTITTYTITYMTNGGSEIEQQTVAAGSIITGPPSTTIREGYELVGWYLTEDFSDPVEFPYKVMGNSVFYAKWEQVEDVVITFVTNCDLVLASKTVPVGTMIDLEELIRTGYEFNGWYSDIELTNKVESPITATENITLYAKWTALPMYTITYVVNGGTELEPLTVYSGTHVNLGIPTKDYYVFDSWYLDENLTNKITSPYQVVEDVVLYAKYTPAAYSVTFVVNGGTAVNKVYGNIETPITLPTTTKTGYNFGGWYYNEDLTQEVIEPITLTENITVYAKWEEVVYYTITLITNNNSVVEEIVAEENSVVQLPSLTKKDYLFKGWYLEPEFDTLVISPITVNSDITLYAKWEPVYNMIYASDLNTRFVRFRANKMTSDWAFNFSEIEVFADGVNVAFRKRARKSASDGSFVDTVATNGVYNHYRDGNNIVGCDNVPKNNWFTIDLEQGYNIDTVKFFGMDMVHAVNTIEGLELQISEDDNNWYFIEKSDITLNKVSDDTQHTPKVYDLTSVIIRNPQKQYLSDLPVRYIKSKIESESRGYSYSILEVEAYSNGVNVALGKPAKMRNEAYQSSNLATDGNFNNTDSTSPSAYFTLSPYQWMTIDLQGLYKLDNIHYYSFDTYGDNGSSFYWNNHEVLVSPDGETWYVVGKSNEIHVNKTYGWTRDYINYNLTTIEVKEKTKLPLSTLNVKYIKDEQWGNTLADYYANWSEIMAMKNGVNVAKGCPIIQSWDGGTYTNSIITDGILDGQYIGTKTNGRDNPGHVMVTLNTPVNLDSVIIVRGHANQNIGYYNRVLVSEDKVTWYVIYDSIEEGVYTESVNGREFTTYK